MFKQLFKVIWQFVADIYKKPREHRYGFLKIVRLGRKRAELTGLDKSNCLTKNIKGPS